MWHLTLNNDVNIDINIELYNIAGAALDAITAHSLAGASASACACAASRFSRAFISSRYCPSAQPPRCSAMICSESSRHGTSSPAFACFKTCDSCTAHKMQYQSAHCPKPCGSGHVVSRAVPPLLQFTATGGTASGCVIHQP